MILQHSQDLYVLSYEPVKAVSDDFEAHRRGFCHTLYLLTKRSKNMSLVILSYLDQDFVVSKSRLKDTFVGLLDSFPNINLESIHFFLEPVNLGWYSYQENAKCLAIQLFGELDDKSSFHMLPSLSDGKENDVDVKRPQIMAFTANIRTNLQSLDDFREGDLLSDQLVATPSFWYPLDLSSSINK